ncbi:DUF2474 family protein [Agrobacterium rubi]|nr:DUF2474 family protein [Agrobacterium rubi]MBP1881476.1 hypothetical protein [Agrobacterium rubi]NTF09343.1 DUF2474 family protein [Agrobacterium rubi]NTF22253.1 DUF2474 family protein [Agrobacterium rubi]NTF29110.1 DUF2474 family protein [Agrobacterium rubi]
MPETLFKRFLWFVGLWFASVLVLFVVAYVIRLMILG